jgi:hypothetical protein
MCTTTGPVIPARLQQASLGQRWSLNGQLLSRPQGVLSRTHYMQREWWLGKHATHQVLQ